jgi:hypothetical protein
LIALTFLVTAPNAHAAKKFKPVTQLIVLNKSIGGVKLGQSAKKAKAAWGSSAACGPTSAGVQYCQWKGKDPEGTATYTLQNGKVVNVSITCGFKDGKDFIGPPLNNLKSKKKIHLGSTSKKVMDAYPGGQVVNGNGPNGPYVASYRLNGNKTAFNFTQASKLSGIVFANGLIGY